MRRRSLLLTRPERLGWVEEELPPLQPDGLLIQTEAGAISIGHAAWYFHLVRADARGLEQIFDYSITAGCLIETFARLASGAIRPVKVLVSYK